MGSNKKGGAPLNAGKMMARHILVDKLGQAQDIYDKLQKGANFESLARQNSNCPSKKRGGNLGWFKKGDMVSEFWDGCFALQLGEVSKPVKTKFGYHLIKRMK